VVVSGDKAAVERAVEIARGKGARRAMRLPVSAPFHCALMRPAADAMAAALASVTVKPPLVPVVANALVRPISEPADIVCALVAQVTGTVRWRESIAFMAAAGVTTFYEVGAGKVLSGLVRRIADRARGVRSERRTMSRYSGSPRRDAEERSMFDLTGKTALITGASGGIGGAIARAFHQQGATVALSGTRREMLDRLSGELKDRTHVVPCNLANRTRSRHWCPSARKSWASSTSWWPMPGSTKTISWFSCATRIGTRWLRSI